jgi:hypothetical protein
MSEQNPPPQVRQRSWTVLDAVRIFLAIVFIVGPPIYLAARPADYKPPLQVMISIFLFLLAYWVGYRRESEAAARKANDRWLPQAESVIYRLMTLRTNVRGFSRTTKANCSSAACDLPELEKPELKAVRIKMKADCQASSQRLDDIAHQLEDAIEDWRRFIIANCRGEECARIWDALWAREDRLEREFQEPTPTAASGSPGLPSVPLQSALPPSAPAAAIPLTASSGSAQAANKP